MLHVASGAVHGRRRQYASMETRTPDNHTRVAGAARLQARELTSATLRTALPRICAISAEALRANASINFVRPLRDGEIAACWEKAAARAAAGERTMVCKQLGTA